MNDPLIDLVRELVDTLEHIQKTERLGIVNDAAARLAIVKGRKRIAEDERAQSEIRRLSEQRRQERRA